MIRIILLSTVTAAILLDGYVHGLWTNRWGSTQVMDHAVAGLERVPLAIGDWHGQAQKLGARQAQQAGFSGYWLRRYDRRTDGSSVTVMLACGLPGPLSVHTPDVCYGGAGFVQAGSAERHEVSRETATPVFWTAKFSKRDAVLPVNLRLYYSWRTADGWKASSNPRWDFASQPVLYKMYICHEMMEGNERQGDAACAEFIKLLLPELEQALAGPL